mmetsp:Transcript_62300/g.147625  ORF Transcript_62300/g.147625 Transcript_62300/m.147625 type:complete len:439 (+) Transcript_62300:1-1317(+)
MEQGRGGLTPFAALSREEQSEVKQVVVQLSHAVAYSTAVAEMAPLIRQLEELQAGQWNDDLLRLGSSEHARSRGAGRDRRDSARRGRAASASSSENRQARLREQMFDILKPPRGSTGVLTTTPVEASTGPSRPESTRSRSRKKERLLHALAQSSRVDAMPAEEGESEPTSPSVVIYSAGRSPSTPMQERSFLRRAGHGGENSLRIDVAGERERLQENTRRNGHDNSRTDQNHHSREPRQHTGHGQNYFRATPVRVRRRELSRDCANGDDAPDGLAVVAGSASPTCLTSSSMLPSGSRPSSILRQHNDQTPCPESAATPPVSSAPVMRSRSLTSDLLVAKPLASCAIVTPTPPATTPATPTSSSVVFNDAGNSTAKHIAGLQMLQAETILAERREKTQKMPGPATPALVVSVDKMMQQLAMQQRANKWGGPYKPMPRWT